MPTMRSGLVMAGGFAYKVRKVVFAQLAEELKEKRLDSKNVAFSVAQLNRFLFTLLVDKLRVDKRDAVRISVDYDVSEGKIVWKFDTLKVEVFRRVPEDEIGKVLAELVPEAEKIMAAPLEYRVEYVGETNDGDRIYALNIGGQEVGLVEVIPIDEEFLYIKVGALTAPEPTKVEKIKMPLEGRTPEEVLRTAAGELIGRGKPVSAEEADSIVGYIRGRLSEARPEAKVEYE